MRCTGASPLATQPSGEAWHVLACLPAQRWSVAVCLAGMCLHAAAGRDSKTLLQNSVFKLPNSWLPRRYEVEPPGAEAVEGCLVRSACPKIVCRAVWHAWCSSACRGTDIWLAAAMPGSLWQQANHAAWFC